VHIEQGPVLDGLGVPLGIVTGIPLPSRDLDRRREQLFRRDHARLPPRRPPPSWPTSSTWNESGCGADGHKLVCTVCVLATGADAAFTLIAGSARIELDTRSVSRDSLDDLHNALEQLAAEVSERLGVTIELGPEIPVSAARSGTRGRPPRGRGAATGSNGSMIDHRASDTRGEAMSPHESVRRSV